MIRLIEVNSPQEVETVRALFLEYAGSLGFDLCFQDFEAELADLPGDYAPPQGWLIIAWCDDRPAGCIALRPISETICEMKRMYIRPHYRRRGIGRRLAEAVICKAQSIGYARMRLDTVPSMTDAITLYRGQGFREVAPYRHNPLAGAMFFELDLRSLQEKPAQTTDR